jgi:DNA polymerase I-like protein with 3'-5' exonuclease and polymerase domains
MRAFMVAVKRMNSWKSKILFPVHDELVLDLHLEDGEKLASLQEAMERAVVGHRFKIKIKKGLNYDEATN